MNALLVGRIFEALPDTTCGRGGTSEPGEGQEPSITQLPTDPVTRLERDALMALLQHPDAVGRDYALRVTQVALTNATLAVVRDGIAASMDAFDSPRWLERVAEEVPTGFSGIVHQLGVAPIPEKEGRELSIYCSGVAASLIGRDLLSRKAELLGRLQRTDAAAEPERYRELQRELMQVEADRRVLIAD